MKRRAGNSPGKGGRRRESLRESRWWLPESVEPRVRRGRLATPRKTLENTSVHSPLEDPPEDKHPRPGRPTSNPLASDKGRYPNPYRRSLPRPTREKKPRCSESTTSIHNVEDPRNLQRCLGAGWNQGDDGTLQRRICLSTPPRCHRGHRRTGIRAPSDSV